MVCTAFGLQALPSAAAPSGPSPMVVGGSNASKGAYPSIVSVQPTGGHYCGGTLIDPSWVMTAAHCVEQYSQMRIVLGEHNLNVSEGSEQTISSSRIISHPNYSNVIGGYDIALIKLSRPATLNRWVRIATLDSSSDAQAGTHSTVAGWGRLYGNGPFVIILQHVSLLVVSNSTCGSSLGNSSMVCAGYSDGQKGGCHGDSGGPLFANGRQIGIVSWGDPGCSSYTVFASVPALKSWIQQYVPVN